MPEVEPPRAGSPVSLPLILFAAYAAIAVCAYGACWGIGYVSKWLA